MDLDEAYSTGGNCANYCRLHLPHGSNASPMQISGYVLLQLSLCGLVADRRICRGGAQRARAAQTGETPAPPRAQADPEEVRDHQGRKQAVELLHLL